LACLAAGEAPLPFPLKAHLGKITPLLGSSACIAQLSQAPLPCSAWHPGPEAACRQSLMQRRLLLRAAQLPWEGEGRGGCSRGATALPTRPTSVPELELKHTHLTPRSRHREGSSSPVDGQQGLGLAYPPRLTACA
uniref:Uncharacterized protein n=1 Tax=Varanus komodoensis TaxID=61221 RepID=A0A8D2KQI5_VARKO